MPAARRHVACGAATKRSSPDVTQTEISPLFNAELAEADCASLENAGGTASGTATAANPRADISRKFLREIWFIRGPKLVAVRKPSSLNSLYEIYSRMYSSFDCEIGRASSRER